MPTYEYACSKCGEHLEVVQSFRDDPLTKCPACGGRLKKVFGAVGIVFKGSGFYKTDSRKSSKATKAVSSNADKASESASSSDSSSSSSESAASGKSKETKETKETSSQTKAGSGSSSTPAAAS